MFIDLREMGREGDKNIKVIEKHQLIDCVSHMPQPGREPTTQACALTRNQSSELSGHWATPNSLSHISQVATCLNLTVFYIILFSPAVL